MLPIAFWSMMFGIPSGPLALYGDSLLTCLQMQLIVIFVGDGSGSEYLKIVGTVDSVGFGGKKDVVFTLSLLSAQLFVLSLFFVLMLEILIFCHPWLVC